MLCKRIENQKHFFRAPPSAKIVLIAKFLKILAKLWSQDWPNWLVGFGYNSGYMMHMGPIFWSLWDGAVSQHFFSTQRAYSLVLIIFKMNFWKILIRPTQLSSLDNLTSLKIHMRNILPYSAWYWSTATWCQAGLSNFWTSIKPNQMIWPNNNCSIVKPNIYNYKIDKLNH